MKFNVYNLGYLRGGETVEITLSGSAANVRLMDSSNLSNYRNGRRHTYYGGLMKRSPAQIPVPHSGNWHITVDMQGLVGSTRSSVRVLPPQRGPLPTYNEPALSTVPTLVRNPAENVPPVDDKDNGKEYDVFISHASEDKDEVVRPLAMALQGESLAVWYDEFELRIGDSLRRKIDRGLAASRFGVVVLSKSFFAKGWANYELDGLVTRAVSGDQVILPVWHNVSKAEVVSYSASLADKLARSTATHTVEDIAKEIAEVIRAAAGE